MLPAIKFPGLGYGDSPVWLPIDPKFPHEAYDRLVKAAEIGDGDAVKTAGWELETNVRQAAKTISEKYPAPPHSTDFGLIFPA